MNCRDVEELSGAFALGAVPAEESAQVVEHLVTCTDAHRLVSELIEVAGILSLSVDEVAPPARLRSNLMAAALAGDSVDVVAQRGPILMRPHRRWLSPALLAAAAMFVAAIGMGAWNVNLNHRLNQRSPSADDKAVLAALASGAHVVQLVSSTGIQGQLIEPQDGSAAYLVGTMPAPPPGKAYQAWLMRDGIPVSAGVFKPSGFTVQPLQGSLNGVQLVSFTLEPEQGSKKPTLPVVAQAPVS